VSKEELIQENAKLKEQIAQHEQKYKSLQEQFNQILKLVNGFKSERLKQSDIKKINLAFFKNYQRLNKGKKNKKPLPTTGKRKNTMVAINFLKIFR